MRVFIFGSCVSRDLMPYLAPYGYELVDYVARQSVLSAMSGRVDVEVPEARFSSKFQLRSIRSDFDGDLLPRIDARPGGFDLLLWDLTDERSGVFRFGDAYATDNWELHATRAIDDLEPDERLEFGGDEHFRRWGAAADAFIDELRSRGLLERLVVLAPDFADRYSDGAPFVPFNRTADDYREAFGRYLEHLAIVHGVRFVTAAAGEVATTSEHQWGEAPFHYDRATCRLLAQRISRIAAPLIGSDAALDAAAAVRAAVVSFGDQSPQDEAWTEWRIGDDARSVRLRLHRDPGSRSRSCTVFLTGAVDPAAPESARLFQRSDWVDDIEGAVAFLADPTLVAHPELRAGWGLGDDEAWAVPLMAAAVDGLAERLERALGGPVAMRLVGTATGAYLALAVASLCRSGARAVVASPVFDWSDYSIGMVVRDAVRAATNGRGDDVSVVPSLRVSLAELWRSTACIPPFTMMFNAAAPAEARAAFTAWTECAAEHVGNPSLGLQRVEWFGDQPNPAQPPGREELVDILSRDAAEAAGVTAAAAPARRRRTRD